MVHVPIKVICILTLAVNLNYFLKNNTWKCKASTQRMSLMVGISDSSWREVLLLAKRLLLVTFHVAFCNLPKSRWGSAFLLAFLNNHSLTGTYEVLRFQPCFLSQFLLSFLTTISCFPLMSLFYFIYFFSFHFHCQAYLCSLPYSLSPTSSVLFT